MKINKENQVKRAKRIRFKLKKKPHLRLCSFRSNNHIYVQLIDDEIGKTIVSASSIEKDLRGLKGSPKEIAFKVGEVAGSRILEKKLKNKFHLIEVAFLSRKN